MTDSSRRTFFSFFLIVLLLTASRVPAQQGTEEEKPGRGRPELPSATTNAGASTSAQIPGKPIHIVPYGPPAAPPKAQLKFSGGRSSNNGRVQYWGGPVISQVQPVVVLWGNFVDSASTGGLQQFYTDITTSDYFDLLAEYSTVGLIGFGGLGGTNQAIDNVVFSAPKFTISPSVCPGSATNTACTISDGQIQTEVLAQINAGHLPQPVQDGQGHFDTIYMIYFPPGVSIELDPQTFSCQQGGFCAYHSNVTGGSPAVPYGVFPDFSQGGCSPTSILHGCGLGTPFQNLTSASSHELGEAVTDVDVGSATSFAPPLGWSDGNPADKNTTFGFEIGDFCNQNEAQVTVNGTTYTVQTQLSNMQGGVCVSAPGHFAVSLSTNNAVPGVPFQATVTAQSSQFSQTLFGYNDSVHFTSSDGAASLPGNYTFVPNTDNGAHTFNVTLNTTGQQTITVADTLIKRMTGVSASVDIEHNPDLTVTSTHSGPFAQGDTSAGDTYTLTVTNIGDRATNATAVTVQDNLPFGLTATAISGAGWSCTMPPTLTFSCNRSDALANGSSYPAITVAVNVSSSAPTPGLNTVQVSGGGELNTSNDTAQDSTVIIQKPDLTISKTHIGSFAQGQIGATYTLTVSNPGFAPTTGALVTVTDTVPPGLTATAMSGTGWSCDFSTLTCTRSDVLANGGISSYSPITLTVNVAANAGPNVINSATVSGGGEVNTSNDTTGDNTFITAPASDMVVASTHTGNFTQGQIGATYTLTASNIGPLATSGTVTVSDNLPFDFTATAISGPGWSCSAPPTLSCTRSDSLAGFTSGTIPPAYPPITVTLNVSPNAISSEVNSAFVSGGGELNGQNDLGSDVTTVIQLADLTISQLEGGTLAQGINGATFTLTVSNTRNGSTNGTVTVTDSFSSGVTPTAISGPGWNCTLGTLTCTRSDVLAAFGSYPSITVTFNIAANAPTSLTSTATVSGGGEVITTNDVSTVSLPILPPVTVTGSNLSQMVTAGGTAFFGISVNVPVAGSVTVACTSGVPPGAACGIIPATLTAPIIAAVGISVTTTPAVVGSAQPPPHIQQPGSRPGAPYAMLLPVFAALLLWASGRTHRRLVITARRPAILAGLCFLALALSIPGCGGGGGSSGPPRVATPPGTYMITVTVTNTTINSSATTQLTLVVQ